MVEEFTQPTDSEGDLDLDLDPEAAAERERERIEEAKVVMEDWRRERDAAGIQGEPVASPGIPAGRATAVEAKALPGDGRRGPNPWN